MKKLIALTLICCMSFIVAYAATCSQHPDGNTSLTRVEVHSKYDCNVCKKEVTETWSCDYGHSFLKDVTYSHHMNLDYVVDTETCPYCGSTTEQIKFWKCDGGKYYPKTVVIPHNCRAPIYE